MTYKNPIAELNKPDSGKTITPEEALCLEGDHEFFCPDHDCKDEKRKLILSRSKLDNPFFKHHGKYEHEIRPETLLHKLAIRWFQNRESFEIPSCQLKNKDIKRQTVKLVPDLTVLEYRKLERIRPDVSLTTVSGVKFAIEIIVTSDIHESKRKLIDQFNLPTLRINLSDFYNANPEECRIGYEFVLANLDNLLNDIKLKTWVVPFEERDVDNKLKTSPVNKNSIVIWVLGILTLVVLLYKKFNRKRGN